MAFPIVFFRHANRQMRRMYSRKLIYWPPPVFILIDIAAINKWCCSRKRVIYDPWNRKLTSKSNQSSKDSKSEGWILQNFEKLKTRNPFESCYPLLFPPGFPQQTRIDQITDCINQRPVYSWFGTYIWTTLLHTYATWVHRVWAKLGSSIVIMYAIYIV